MPEMRLRQLDQSGFTYNASGPFTKNKERIEKIKETGNSRYICQKKVNKTCFQHDMANGDFKDLTRRTAPDKYCVIKHLKLLKTQSKIDIKELLLQWFVTFLIKKRLLCVYGQKTQFREINLLVVVLKVKICLINNYQKD